MNKLLGVKVDYNDFVVEFFPEDDRIETIKQIIKPYDVVMVGNSLYIGQMFEYMPTSDDVAKVETMVKAYLDPHVLWDKKLFGVWDIEQSNAPKMVDWTKV